MRIQLLHPPIYVNLHALQATRPSLPLGLAYIAAALRQDGHEVTVLDAMQRKPEQFTPDGALHYIGLRPEEIVEAIDPAADAVGVTAMFSFIWPLVKRIVLAIKERYPEKIIVGGGEHFTEMPEYSLRAAPLDYLVLGEGEATARELLRALEAGRPDPADIPGLAFLRQGVFVQTPPRERIRDLNALPWPAWDLFDPRSYYVHGHVFGVNKGMTMPMLATRGCPYACSYCSNPVMWHRRWYARAPVNVVDEIEQYHRQYGAANFPFHDLTAILKKDWIVTFCEEILRRDLHISWQLPIGTRTEPIDEEVAELLRKTGCTSITFGPESGSPRIREIVGKRMTDEALMRAVRASARSRLNISCFYVIGFPQDTKADLRQSLKLAVRLAMAHANDIALSFFFPVPGTAVYDELVASGRIVPSDEFLLTPIFSMDAVIREEHNYCQALSARDLTIIKYEILLAFYATSLLVRPWRIFQLAWNVLRDKETCRLDIFMNERKRRWISRLRQMIGRARY